jgi:hypothetical protein
MRSVQLIVKNEACGRTARRTNGEEIPLKSPLRRSSRAMVTSACKVDRYRAFGDGFWNLYFTFVCVVL